MSSGQERLIVHYDEIALKRGRRRQFEEQLIANLNAWARARALPLRARNAWGRIFLDEIGEGLTAEAEETVRKDLALFPGVSTFGFVHTTNKDMDSLLTLAPRMADLVAGGTFRVTARRTDKRFPLKSFEIERAFAAAMFRTRGEKLKAAMKGFDREVIIEVLDRHIAVYVKERGIGGLAVGSSGRAVALLSAGFDSPVATFLMMKRGVRILPLHFHSAPQTSDEPIEAAKDLASRLSDFQGRLNLALCPVLPIQLHLEERAPEALRVVLLRRSFMRIACRYAARVKARALITGESVGQVASQTLENMAAIDAAATLPVLRPLAGFNKREIIDLAARIGTEEISARPCEDTCSLFVPRHPETRARLDKVLEAEAKLDLEPLEQEALERMEIARFHYGQALEEEAE
ncbi:tRNA uracil 4-sulfurtransferase ThiI [Thermopetrobacter sp. TC1]|uniref:tRNA uracil 4-sulfurtransferase ThiI n=1 Tax=Thermopetrobacter sp. TC1 TaxID=1495045 RepID=UPI00056FFD40|nr:tRNA uracil 4-sulfurtransferase ThiI [Thermopetrobacter sp. TC1]